jgi:hypothetical protein
MGIVGSMMRRMTLSLVAALILASFPASEAASTSVGGRAYQPDGWIKLCGQSLGCTIDGLPNPWKGRNIYNQTARRQTLSDAINEGEGIRYWITLQNDGTRRDTFAVNGCRGNPDFEVNRVLLGKHKRQDPGARDLTRRYRSDRLSFTLDAGERVVFTLNIITGSRKQQRYECRTAFTSQESGRQDVVAARMSTF